MICVQGLHHYRVTNFFSGMYCVVLGGEHNLSRYRQAHILEQTMCTFLVAGERGGYGTGITGNCSLDTFLILAVTKLYQAVIVKAQPRDIALHSRID